METFVIRMATTPDIQAARDEAELRGVVEHVGSGRRQPFGDARQLLAFLQSTHRDQSEEVEP
jgi:hypothetical protein